jgi:flagellum-specific ATP synthase
MVNNYLNENLVTSLEARTNGLNQLKSGHFWGHVTLLSGDRVNISGLGPVATLGDQISVLTDHGHHIDGEIIKITDEETIAILYEEPTGITVGSVVEHAPENTIRPSTKWVGHVIDYHGRDANGKLLQEGTQDLALKTRPPIAIHRKRLGARLNTSLAAFDTFLPLCQGQRVGLFSGSGVGKSTLLAQLAQGMEADIVILALIGERGREVREFVEHTLGEKGMKRSIVVCATSNDPAPVKKRAAYLAMSLAEFFRDQGLHVLLLFDSLTRFAESHREVALTAGESPSLRGFPPSTFRAIASLAERAGPGTDNTGDITAVFSVLVAGSNMEEPIADMVRGILDGHVVLEREIAERGRYPAINIRRSVSRSLPDAATEEENILLTKARSLLGSYENAAPLIGAGLYTPGADPVLDQAVAIWPALDQFIGSSADDTIEKTFSKLAEVLSPQDASGTALEHKPAT